VRSLALAALCCALALPPVSQGAPYLPPADDVFWGGQGGYTAGHIADFARQSGKHPAVFNYFISWRATSSALHWLSYRLADSTRMQARTLLSVSPEETRLTPAQIARGAGDGFLVALCRLLAEQGQVTYLRPLSEMNNGNNPYSAYDLSGRPRGPAYSVGEFKRAWRRLALVVRGGEVAAINDKLRRLEMPPVQTTAAELPAPRVALLWVPLSFGNPEIAKNHPSHFWPGGSYVDWVGTTWYSPYKRSSAMNALYRGRAWRSKPFVFAEWGVWGRDEPGFVRQFFSFLRSHRRVRMAIYYQSASLKAEFRLATHPQSRAALRQKVQWPRLTGFAPEFAP
jgi:HAMP domain-containing protein